MIRTSGGNFKGFRLQPEEDTFTYPHMDLRYCSNTWARAAHDHLIAPRRHGHINKIANTRSMLIRPM